MFATSIPSGQPKKVCFFIGTYSCKAKLPLILTRHSYSSSNGPEPGINESFIKREQLGDFFRVRDSIFATFLLNPPSWSVTCKYAVNFVENGKQNLVLITSPGKVGYQPALAWAVGIAVKENRNINRCANIIVGKILNAVRKIIIEVTFLARRYRKYPFHEILSQVVRLNPLSRQIINKLKHVLVCYRIKICK